tara:strand:+ start:725 stop:838 length:114 start_codon:yes stop_codon:yes gene_type:complete
MMVMYNAAVMSEITRPGLSKAPVDVEYGNKINRDIAP